MASGTSRMKVLKALREYVIRCGILRKFIILISFSLMVSANFTYLSIVGFWRNVHNLISKRHKGGHHVGSSRAKAETTPAPHLDDTLPLLPRRVLNLVLSQKVLNSLVALTEEVAQSWLLITIRESHFARISLLSNIPRVLVPSKAWY